ncbi:alkaline phosphatase family protein [Trueperella bialowiezensis]|uniref:Type I phosphodiesterase / nucleotide pyrophosphatase n=1 Tax=Trueperella bialowiezensis TaxID=312285 RepID=A0A3S4V5H2_9ACTO|nr:alkaline phosphatase family protein [Trueperella bialowiezensis]VEI12512.1 Type I phosphodiesterase / nucleotide pyrophosphatase [Trueperella bialowiezensis]
MSLEAKLAGAVLPASRNLSGVLPSALAAIGAPEGQKVFDFPAASRACVVLADGLGFHQLHGRIGHAPNLRAFGVDNFITTVAPSTTAAGITAFGTGQLPGTTAMAGYSLRVPNSSTTFNLISWDHPDLNPATWQRQPTLFERSSADLVKIQPKKYVDSGLTLAALRGGRTAVAQSLPSRVDAAVDELAQGADLVYLYWDRIDSVGHRSGWTSPQWTAELEFFDAEFGRLLSMLPADTLVIVTADHGMVDTTEQVDIRDFDDLATGVDVVAGESRAVQVYTDTPDEVADRWAHFFGDDAWVVTKTEVIESGMFGTVNEFTRAAIGDVFAFAKGGLAIVDSQFQSPGALSLVGVHGSLTDQEMHIPLAVGLV